LFVKEAMNEYKDLGAIINEGTKGKILKFEKLSFEDYFLAAQITNNRDFYKEYDNLLFKFVKDCEEKFNKNRCIFVEYSKIEEVIKILKK